MSAIPDRIKQAFDLQSTDPQAWYELARILRIAAGPVQHRLFEIHTMPQTREGIRLEKLACVKVVMLLTGLAFENLLKAIALSRHQSIKDLNKRKRGGHGLVAITDSLTIDLAPAEREFLRRLEEYVVWAGRYPVPLEITAYATSERERLLTFRGDDPALGDRLFARLSAPLEQSG